MEIINLQKEEKREFHINEFPKDRIFIMLEKEFHNKLFSIKFNEFNNHFNGELNYSTFKQWKNKKHFIPLWFIIEIPQVDIYEVEKNIIAYKGPSVSSIIQNPNIPLIEGERVMRILAHLLGDGSVGGGFGSNLPKGKNHSEYRNFTPELLDSFEKDLFAFGKVPTSKNYQHGHVMIPNSIGYILTHIYQIKFDTFNSKVPERLYSLSRDLIAQFLRAFADDEGHVYDSNIDYYSCNKKLLEGILFLMNTKFPEIKTTLIKANNKAGINTKYSFTILHCSQQKYLELIGFDSKQKIDDLMFNIKRGSSSKRKNKKHEILRLLETKEYNAKQLSRIVGIRHSSVLDHLNEWKMKGNAKIIRKEKWSNVWSINKEL